MSGKEETKLFSRRRVISLLGLAVAAGFGALTGSDAEAQTDDDARDARDGGDARNAAASGAALRSPREAAHAAYRSRGNPGSSARSGGAPTIGEAPGSSNLIEAMDGPLAVRSSVPTAV